MGIQITEKYLSPRAKWALLNAKSKSQLLRDALEFYVSREEFDSDSNNKNESSHGNKETEVLTVTDSQMKADIKEIKELLLKMSLNPAYAESVISRDVNSTSESQIQTMKMDKTANDKVPEGFNKPIVEESKVSTNDKGSNLSEEQKRKIQEELENSILNF